MERNVCFLLLAATIACCAQAYTIPFDYVRRAVKGELESFRVELTQGSEAQRENTRLLQELVRSVQSLTARYEKVLQQLESGKLETSHAQYSANVVSREMERRFAAWTSEVERRTQLDRRICDPIRNDVQDIKNKVNYMYKSVYNRWYHDYPYYHHRYRYSSATGAAGERYPREEVPAVDSGTDDGRRDRREHGETKEDDHMVAPSLVHRPPVLPSDTIRGPSPVGGYKHAGSRTGRREEFAQARTSTVFYKAYIDKHNKDNRLRTGDGQKARAREKQDNETMTTTPQPFRLFKWKRYGPTVEPKHALSKPRYRYMGRCPRYVASGGLRDPKTITTITDTVTGVWMKDTGLNNGKVWVVEGTNAMHWRTITEYDSEDHFNRRSNRRFHDLPEPCSGLGPVVYMNYLYCHAYDTDPQTAIILRIDLNTNRLVTRGVMDIPTGHPIGVAYRGWAGIYHKVQLGLDEKGLWAVTADDVTKRLIIFHLDINDLKIIGTLKTSEKKDNIGPVFFVCGVMYAMDSHYANYVKYRYDTNTLAEKRFIRGEIPFPHMDLTSVQYNPVDRSLYLWRITREESPVRTYGVAEKLTPTLFLFPDVKKK